MASVMANIGSVAPTATADVVSLRRAVEAEVVAVAPFPVPAKLGGGLVDSFAVGPEPSGDPAVAVGVGFASVDEDDGAGSGSPTSGCQRRGDHGVAVDRGGAAEGFGGGRGHGDPFRIERWAAGLPLGEV